jgi:hypothetical protein
MHVQLDALNQVALIVAADYTILDAFEVRGRTLRQIPEGASHYTFRSYTVPAYHCMLCGRSVEQISESCTSRQGFHAFVGDFPPPPAPGEPISQAGSDVPPMHRAPAWDLPILSLRFEDLCFYVERDNLFVIEEIAVPWRV